MSLHWQTKEKKFALPVEDRAGFAFSYWQDRTWNHFDVFGLVPSSEQGSVSPHFSDRISLTLLPSCYASTALLAAGSLTLDQYEYRNLLFSLSVILAHTSGDMNASSVSLSNAACRFLFCHQ